jgi:hypothetical protein
LVRLLCASLSGFTEVKAIAEGDYVVFIPETEDFDEEDFKRLRDRINFRLTLKDTKDR